MVRECHKCGKQSDDNKRCSACHKVYYCSQQCQKWDWVAHIFDCNPRRPITTADHLALAVGRNLLPEDPQTCEDYGFNKAWTAQARSMLLGLYIGLMNRMKIKSKTIHKWRVDGTLVLEIKKAFNQLPVNSRGGYYAWFLENQHVLDGSASPTSHDALIEATLKRAWRMAGGSASDDANKIRQKIKAMPQKKQDCLLLYQLLLDQWHPGPGITGWISFGFCACRAEEEIQLGGFYRSLISRCSFEEFFTAYKSSSLLGLFHLKGIRPTIPHLDDVLRGSPYVNKSVWDLKEFVVNESGENLEPIPPVRVDYGFMYCGPTEVMELKRVYARYFEHRDGDPIALHEAAIQGRLFEHINGLFKVEKKFRKLMRNPYPLPDH